MPRKHFFRSVAEAPIAACCKTGGLKAAWEAHFQGINGRRISVGAVMPVRARSGPPKLKTGLLEDLKVSRSDTGKDRSPANSVARKFTFGSIKQAHRVAKSDVSLTKWEA